MTKARNNFVLINLSPCEFKEFMTGVIPWWIEEAVVNNGSERAYRVYDLGSCTGVNVMMTGTSILTMKREWQIEN
jgi:hypothetical protein